MSAKLPGRVAAVYVDEGSRVSKGQPLLTLESDYLRLNLQRAEADAARAKAMRDAKRRALYAKIQRIAANDAFQGFLYYSPFRWAYTSKLHGFFVQPLGNYHLEDAWLG